MALELKETGVVSLCLLPSPVKTEIIRSVVIENPQSVSRYTHMKLSIVGLF